MVLATRFETGAPNGIWRLRPAAGTRAAHRAVVAGDGDPRRRDADPRAPRELPPRRVAAPRRGPARHRVDLFRDLPPGPDLRARGSAPGVARHQRPAPDRHRRRADPPPASD